MIWSVSTFSMGSGTQVEVNVVNFSVDMMCVLCYLLSVVCCLLSVAFSLWPLAFSLWPLQKFTGIGDLSGYGCSSGGKRTCQESTCPRSLPAFKIPVGG